MKIKIRAGSSALQEYPWLANKELWNARGRPSFYLIDDPEIPSFCEGQDVAVYDDSVESVVYNGELVPMTITAPAVVASNSTMGSYWVTCNSVAAGQGLMVSSSGSLGLTEQTKPRHIGDLELSEVRREAIDKDMPAHELKTMKVNIDPQSPYGQAFKGLSEMLNGLFLKFWATDDHIDCEEYRSGPTMILASTKEAASWDVYAGAHVERLRGLRIPAQFLEA
jgi:hypothetical protein